MPTWLTGPVLLSNFIRTNKNYNLVREVKLITANPTYAHFRFPIGKEYTVSLRDLAPIPRGSVSPSSQSVDLANESAAFPHCDNIYLDYDDEFNHEVCESASDNDSLNVHDTSDQKSHTPEGDHVPNSPEYAGSCLSRSSRMNKGVPPARHGDPISF